MFNNYVIKLSFKYYLLLFFYCQSLSHLIDKLSKHQIFTVLLYITKNDKNITSLCISKKKMPFDYYIVFVTAFISVIIFKLNVIF